MFPTLEFEKAKKGFDYQFVFFILEVVILRACYNSDEKGKY